MDEGATETLWSGRFIEVRRRGTWEYAVRARSLRAGVIVALDGGRVGAAQDRHILLVEQWRTPLGARCLELPAGLVGDEDEDDTPEAAATRELEEECGYRAARVESLGEFAFSPGMTDERFMLMRATALTRVGDGGGVAGEDIAVHRVPLGELARFVESRRAGGVQVAAPLLAVLGGYLKLSA